MPGRTFLVSDDSSMQLKVLRFLYLGGLWLVDSGRPQKHAYVEDARNRDDVTSELMFSLFEQSRFTMHERVCQTGHSRSECAFRMWSGSERLALILQYGGRNLR